MSAPRAPWEVNSSYVRSLERALRSQKRTPSELSIAAARMLATPSAESWWPGDHFIELLQGLEREFGRPELDQLSIRASHDGMGPLVRPLVSVVLAFAKSRPHALFSRVATFTAVGVRGVKANFEAKPSGAVVTFVFPHDVAPVMATVWVGMMDLGFSLAQSGRVERVEIEPAMHRYTMAF